MRFSAGFLGILLATLVLLAGAPAARADHGEWQDRKTRIEPVREERTRLIPGRWKSERVWVPPRTVTSEDTITVAVEVEYQYFVNQGHWDVVNVWVEDFKVRCRIVNQWYQDCSDFWGPCRWVYGPREECKRVDVSYFRLERRWVDTSYWETRTRTEHRQETRTVSEEIPGFWDTRQRWVPDRTETYWQLVSPGRWVTTRIWVQLPHTEVANDPARCRPRGIYKVSSNYVGNKQWTDGDGTIHYGTETSREENPWWAVSLGSVSKGSGSRYDAQAFNGRGRGADGLLLAGRFYRNYLPDGDCFEPANVVFFQDDTVVAGDLDDPTIPDPAQTPGVGSPIPAPSPTPAATPAPGKPPSSPTASPTTAPTAAPTRRPTIPPLSQTQTPVSLDPGGEFAFAVAIEGSGAVTGPGQATIQVLRGAPVEVYLLPRLAPPNDDPDAAVSFWSWSYLSGRNDHPRAPVPGAGHGPLQPLLLRLDARPAAGRAQHQIELSARVRVIAGDGRVEDFELPVTLLAQVHYQAIA